MAFSGGDPDHLHTGGQTLTRASTDVTSCHHGIDETRSKAVAGSAGSAVAAATQRFAAAYGAEVDGIGTELRALGLLADMTGEDIVAATTSAHRGRGAAQ